MRASPAQGCGPWLRYPHIPTFTHLSAHTDTHAHARLAQVERLLPVLAVCRCHPVFPSVSLRPLAGSCTHRSTCLHVRLSLSFCLHLFVSFSSFHISFLKHPTRTPSPLSETWCLVRCRGVAWRGVAWVSVNPSAFGSEAQIAHQKG